MGLDQRLAIHHQGDEVWGHSFRKVNFLHRWVERQPVRRGRDQLRRRRAEPGAGGRAGPDVRGGATSTRPRAPSYCPPRRGSSSGTPSYDGYYLADVLDVLDACNRILAHGAVHHAHGGDPFKVIYWSWW